MCGLLGVYSEGRRFGETDLRKALEQIEHRGPDESSYLHLSDHKLCLGHNRLSVIGLENGRQPFLSSDGLVSVIVNGEFYEHRAIRQSLELDGAYFQSDSDSEIALHLYLKYGLDFLSHLRGEFALVLWDERSQSLIAARDRFGIKPLVYSLSNDGVAFASEAKALFALGYLEAEWDCEAYFATTARQYLSPDRSLFKGVKQVRPGECVVYRKGEIQRSQYWDLDYPIEKLQKPESELIEDYRHAFEEAVALRLEADVPVAVHLSGGLDSTAVACLAKKYQGQADCFTVSFDQEGYDELKLAEETAEYLGVNLHKVAVSCTDIIENFESAVYHSEGLGVNGHFSSKFLLNRAINNAGFKVALTGEGADELLAGYPHLREDLYANEPEYLSELFQENKASSGIMLAEGKSLGLSSVQERMTFVPAFLKAKASMGYKMFSILDQDFLNLNSHRDCYDELLNDFELDRQVYSRSPLDQSLYLWNKTALSQYILKTLGDGCEMAWSIEGRLPFLDHKLFEFCRALPQDLKIKGRTEKYILREAFKDLLPPTIYERKKHPFMAPPLSRRQEMQDFIQDSLRSKSFAAMPFFDHVKVRASLDSLQSMTEGELKAIDPVFFSLLSAYFIQKSFMEKSS